jgi:hypothetical protein
MKFRRLTDEGIAAFATYLNRLREDSALEPPTVLLSDAAASEPLAVNLSAEPEPFATRFDFARWLHEAAEKYDVEVPRGDAAFWSWLSLALFDQVCPEDGNGRRKLFEKAWYIPG